VRALLPGKNAQPSLPTALPHCVPPTPRHTTRRLRLPPESCLKKLRKDLEKWRWVEFEPNPYGKKKHTITPKLTKLTVLTSKKGHVI